MGLWQAEAAGEWPRAKPAPDPEVVRAENLALVTELGFPMLPEGYPLVWEVGDNVSLRPTVHLEARAAVLNCVLARCFGAGPQATAGWLAANELDAHVTGPERAFLERGDGTEQLYGLHIEAVWALAWLLGVADELDPSQYCGDGLKPWLPDLRAGEPFDAWRERNQVRVRPAEEAASLLDLHYCLDWGLVEALLDGQTPPGTTQPYVVGQRRWALEWAVIFTGPYHSDPPAWDDVDLES